MGTLRISVAKHLILALTALVISASAVPTSFTQFIGFGDSTMDSGYFRYNTTGSASIDAMIQAAVANGGSGHFTGPGKLNTTLLAARFGLTANPYVVADGSGTNFSNGSAQTNVAYADNKYGFPTNISTVGQINTYLASVGKVANRNALYMVGSGANDLLYAQTTTTTLPSNYLSTQANALVTGVSTLHAAGARTIIMLSVFNYARLIGATGVLSAADADKIIQSTAFNNQVWTGLAAAGVNFVPADADSLMTYVSKNPAKFGFTAANVLSSNPAVTTSSAMIATPSQLVSPDAEQTHLFADSKHLTTAGQTIEVDYIYNLLAAPGQISLLPEAAVHSTLHRTATIQDQLASSVQRSSLRGANPWFIMGAQSLRLKNSADLPTSSGTPYGGTVGVDFQMPNGPIWGAAISLEDQTQDYSSGGSFRQANETLSLYVSSRVGSFSSSAILSYGLLQNSIERQVALGRFTEKTKGDAGGRSLGLALRGAYEFQVSQLFTGPVVGLVMQQQQINGFTETDGSSLAALSFGHQSRNSAVTQLGWRAVLNMSTLEPFAVVEWNHDFAARGRSLRSSLTSITAPSYLTDAAPVARNWGSAAIGVSFKLSARLVLRASATTSFGSSYFNRYGGDLSLRHSF